MSRIVVECGRGEKGRIIAAARPNKTGAWILSACKEKIKREGAHNGQDHR